METFTLIYFNGVLTDKQEFDDYESLRYFVNNYVDDGIEVKVIKNTWHCVSQTPNLFTTPF